MTGHTVIPVSRVFVAVATVAVVLTAAIVGIGATDAAVGSADDPADNGTVAVSNVTVAPGEPAQAQLSLSALPDGLSGFEATVRLSNPDAATISDAALADDVGMGDATVVEDGTAVRFKAADTAKAMQPGDGPVTLGTITVVGTSPGETGLTVEVNQLDDEQGTALTPVSTDGLVTVTTPETETETETDTDTDTQTTTSGAEKATETDTSTTMDQSSPSTPQFDSMPGFGVQAVVLALAFVAGCGATLRRQA